MENWVAKFKKKKLEEVKRKQQRISSVFTEVTDEFHEEVPGGNQSSRTPANFPTKPRGRRNRQAPKKYSPQERLRMRLNKECAVFFTFPYLIMPEV